MVLRVDVVAAALDAVYGGVPEHRVVALTPQGRQLDQAVVEELAAEERLTLLSARFEGFDERIVQHLCSDAISIGPYILSGGELPAMVVVDAVARLLPGALGDEESRRIESFSAELDGGLEYPQYTRPAEFRGWHVPDVPRPATTPGSTSGAGRRAGREARLDRAAPAVRIRARPLGGRGRAVRRARGRRALRGRLATRVSLPESEHDRMERERRERARNSRNPVIRATAGLPGGSASPSTGR